MKVTSLALALLFGSAAAFAPSARTRPLRHRVAPKMGALSVGNAVALVPSTVESVVPDNTQSTLRNAFGLQVGCFAFPTGSSLS